MASASRRPPAAMRPTPELARGGCRIGCAGARPARRTTKTRVAEAVTAVDETEERFAVDLPSGPVEVAAAYGRPDDAWATIAIAHGAGAGYAHPFLIGFARGMREEGVATLRFNFPYLQLGRRMPGPAAHAIATWTAAAAFARERSGGAARLGIGQVVRRPHGVDGRRGGRGRSGRAVYLGYPLHPPGDPAKARVAHLPSVRSRSCSSRARTIRSSPRSRSSKTRLRRVRMRRSPGSTAAGTLSR